MNLEAIRTKLESPDFRSRGHVHHSLWCFANRRHGQLAAENRGHHSMLKVEAILFGLYWPKPIHCEQFILLYWAVLVECASFIIWKEIAALLVAMILPSGFTDDMVGLVDGGPGRLTQKLLVGKGRREGIHALTCLR